MANKKNLFWIVLSVNILLSVSIRAQEFPTDESGKIFFSDVVKADSLINYKLFSNGKRWLKSLTTSEEKFTFTLIDSLQSKITGNYEFQVFTQSGMLRKMVGLIVCKLSLETKDRKYRYSFSEFVFHYYAQNRNYQMAKTGKTKPLEEPTAAGWQKTWMKHRQTTFTKINNLIDAMKTELTRKEFAVTKKVVKKNLDW